MNPPSFLFHTDAAGGGCVRERVEFAAFMRRASIVLLPLALILALVLWRAQGPDPVPASAPVHEFSAIRARTALAAVLVEGVPHPIATRANARVRSRLETQFRALGYETSVQRRFACNASANCAVVENVIARKPGPAAGGAIVLLAHYDSVAAGPGASDDGMGVATLLETARAIRGETFRNPVMFVLTDGEEAGLLGAEGFTADPSLMRGVSTIINVDMRGTYGPSHLIETSRGNRWLIRHLANALDRPSATSLFFSIYELLPNDTDVTVFKRAGTAAVNFAASEGVNWYHTPMDDLAHASPRTLQHHGQNVLGTLRVLGNADLAARSSTDATYFDVLNFFLVWWPQEWTLWIAIISLVALLFASRRLTPRAMTFGVLTAFLAVLLAAIGGSALAWVARRGTAGVNFAPQPLPSIAAMWLAGIAAALFAAALLNRKKEPEAMLAGVAIVWHAIGIALALALPGAAYLFIIPGVAVAICTLLQADETLTAAIGGTVAAILMFPLGAQLYDALGGALMAAIAVLLALFTTLIAPVFARKSNALILLVAAIACAVVAMNRPASTPERPRAIPLAYVDDTGFPSPIWYAGVLTAPLKKAAAFAPADTSLTPWSRGSGWYAAPAPRLLRSRVSVTAERQGSIVRVVVRSAGNGNRLSLLMHGGVVRRVNGLVPPPRSARGGAAAPSGWQFASAAGVQEMVVEVKSRERLELVASEVTFAFPAEGAALVQARNASPAMTIQDGDVIITRSRTAI
jgi:hypothetical protein